MNGGKVAAIVVASLIGIGTVIYAVRKANAQVPLGGRPAPASGLGDIDGDGYVTEADCQAVKDYLLGKREFTDDEFYRADVLQDGRINVGDYSKLKLYMAYKTELD